MKAATVNRCMFFIAKQCLKVFMANRTQSLYEAVLRKLHELYENDFKFVRTLEIRTDEEPAQFNSWNVVFGPNGLGKDVQIGLCYFHYAQNLVRKFKAG